MRIISFSGLDGSGKSTQLKLLADFLEKQEGKRVRVIHIIQNSVANRILKRQHKKNKAKPEADPRAACQSGFLKTCVWGVLLRKVAMLIDIVFFRLFLLMAHARYDVLLCDRYFYDYLINIYYLEDRQEAALSPFLKTLIPKPDLAFYLALSPQKALERKAEQDAPYFKAKNQLFQELAQDLSLIIIDSSVKVSEVADEIKKYYQELKQ